MLNGLSTEGALALRVIEDFQHLRGYRLHLAVARVVHHRRTLISDGPSYVWWTLGMEEGEISPIIDMGPSYWHDCSPNYSFLHEKVTSEGVWEAIVGRSIGYLLDDPTPLDAMLHMGLNFHVHYCSRVKGSWGQPSYFDNECELDYETKIVFADPTNRIDIPLDFDAFPRPRFKSLRLA